jgi:hypothetical protein
MDNKIKKAISKAMGKLVGFSLNEKAMNGHTIEVTLMGRFRHDVWVVNDSGNAINITASPKTIADIPAFENEIEKAIAELKAKFLDPKKTWIDLNAEAANE